MLGSENCAPTTYFLGMVIIPPLEDERQCHKDVLCDVRQVCANLCMKLNSEGKTWDEVSECSDAVAVMEAGFRGDFGHGEVQVRE